MKKLPRQRKRRSEHAHSLQAHKPKVVLDKRESEDERRRAAEVAFWKNEHLKLFKNSVRANAYKNTTESQIVESNQ